MERLADELAALTREERTRVLASVARKTPPPRAHSTLTWDKLRSVEGIVSLGGNAVEDCERLYDG